MSTNPRTAMPAPAVGIDLQPALNAFASTLPDEDQDLTMERVAGVRSIFASFPRLSDEESSRGGAFTVATEHAPGLDGAPDVPLLVFRPTAAAPTGWLLWVHGGGMVFGSFRDGIDEMLDYAAATGAALVSVDYRLAPETPHPGPVEDCYAALLWTRDQASADTPLIVIGGSAGGGIAAGATLMARERADVRLAGQMLLAPMLDHRNDTASLRNLGHPTVWSRQANGFGWAALLADTPASDVSPFASPAVAPDLQGLPSSYIDVGGADGFRDEDAEYAIRLGGAGVLIEFHLWPGGYHGFEGMAPDAEVSRAARAARSAWLARTLAGR